MPHRPQSADGRDPWRAHVLTLFPEMFPGPLGLSLTGQALTAGLWSLSTTHIRDFGIGRHRSVDDTPAGGGAGMVMRADVLAAATDHARAAPGHANLPLVYLSPRGEPFTQALAHEFASGPGLMLLAGRFEGVDQRVIEGRQMREISLGDFVLSGGEIAAMAVLDACLRLIPGVLGAAESLTHESFEMGLLEYPQYTRPRSWEGRDIPDVLLTGDHARIARWQKAEAERITRERRPDLMARARPVAVQSGKMPKGA
ncbi:MAG: tRNA (guanosine(37)-N1)-methyltransferase TrmD [Hyphomicrobiaceae bacterium]|nr:tRNA (guanosine(37)-N1)-methyltransferase TrmD [Hyphomicrobiaceae bacterium]